jgi:hypothetical protein
MKREDGDQFAGNPSRSRRCNRGLTLPNVTVKRAPSPGSWEDAEFGMIRKPEDLPENAADKHFAEECCRYEQTMSNVTFSLAMIE